ncbi:MAG TPA: spermidine/putrescine ABC transporter permease PotC, partial [Reyranella sp.]
MKRAGDLWQFPGARAAALAVLFFLYMPIVTLVAMSFNTGDSLTIWSGFGLRWYGVVLDNDDMLRAIRNSLVIATVATLAGTTIATMAALALARGSFRGKRAIQALLGLPLVVPEIVAAIAILLLFVL